MEKLVNAVEHALVKRDFARKTLNRIIKIVKTNKAGPYRGWAGGTNAPGPGPPPGGPAGPGIQAVF